MRFVTAVAVALLLAAAPAGAQRRADPSTQEPVLFVADELRVDQELGLVVAAGKVEIAQGKRRLLADTVTYNQKTDTITASGNVSLIEPTGEILSGSYIELTDQMAEGFANDVRVLMTDRARLAGNAGRRTGGNRTEIRKGIYSPCELCKDNPSAAPLWAIKAGTIVHDDERHVVEYFDAFFEAAGVPVLYVPYFSHPDPTVKRQTGFLPPTIGNSATLGFNLTTPFFWAIDGDKDLTVSPVFTTLGGNVAAGEYRQRFNNGTLSLAGSIVEDNVDQAGFASLDGALRGHVFSEGRFDIDERWRTGFDLRRATDQTYLRRYRFNETITALTSRGFVEGFEPRAYLGASAYAFQPLRQFFEDRRQPVVLPVVEGDWALPPDPYGGLWRLDGNVVNLLREAGNDTQRLSLGAGYRLPVTGPLGTLWSFGASLRGDAYYVSDFALPGGATENGFEGRAYPQLAMEVRWPWVRRGESWSQLIEPVAAAYAAPSGLNRSAIPNNDSESFDFDDNDLFVANRFYGRDRVDDGQRVDYGVRGAIYGPNGGSQFIVGQSYRINDSSSFFPGSGLDSRLSDIVGRVSVFPGAGFDLTYRFRLDKDDFSLERQEVRLSGGPDQARFSVAYVELPPGGGEVLPREQITASAVLGLTQYWRTALSTTRNLSGANNTLSSAISALYQDECLAFAVTLAQSGTRDRDVEPGTYVYFTLVLKNLGEIVAPVFSGRPGSG